ncbi:MAG TPA: acetate kinase [Candidatus Binatia bacterium]|nr:acetate kinase [Candidatus Binatia bacterium]
MIKSGSVLVINCGSSSIKFSVVDHETSTHVIRGSVDRIGEENAQLEYAAGQDKGSQSLGAVDHEKALQSIASVLNKRARLQKELLAVGHRVVHGGERFSTSSQIDDHVLSAIEGCNHLAPLHNPANVLGIRTAQRLFPGLPQVAVFDTAFHQTLPQRAYLYAIPYNLYKEHGIRRYGFHGTSHRFVTERAAALLKKPLGECTFVSAHLGNGCSACAVLNGKSVETTMGLTPLEGLVMGTRSGDVDPGLHAHLQEQLGWDLDHITDVLNNESGLLGLSGLSNDMRELIAAAAAGNENADLAIEVFCYRLAKAIGGLFVSLGRVGTVIFTGGIGENAPSIRAKVVQHLSLFGFDLDPERNAAHGARSNGWITKDRDPIAMVVPTDEELMIARETITLLS